MKLTRTSRLLVGTLAAMTLTLSACSSSDGDNSSSNSANKAASNSNKGGGGSVGDKEFCQKAVAAGIELNKRLGQSNQNHIADSAKTWSDLAKIAPDDIRSDVQAIADAFGNGAKDLAAALEAYKEPMKRYTAWGQTHCLGVKPPTQP